MRGSQDGGRAYSDQNISDKESCGLDRAAFSGGNLISKRTSSKSARFTLPKERSPMVGTTSNKCTSGSGGAADTDEAHVEITLDLRDDYTVIQSVKTAAGDEPEGQEIIMTLVDRKKPEKNNSFSSRVFRDATSKLHQVSHELKRFASLSEKPAGRIERTKTAAGKALVGFRFIPTTKTGGLVDWKMVEEQFDYLTKKTDGILPASKFGKCIGMSEDQSNQFAEELFKALARRHNIATNIINKSELREFWDTISDKSFDSSLQIFFDMVDKDGNGRITEEEIAEHVDCHELFDYIVQKGRLPEDEARKFFQQILSLSASANKLTTIQEHANEYAALIMEELDPDKLGYITTENLETLLLQAPTLGILESKNLSVLLSQKLKSTTETNLIKRWYDKTKYFVMDDWQRVWVMSLWLAILAGLFTYKFVQYRNETVFSVMGYCVCTAKGAAETLKFNMALILLPVCRNTITWLRNKSNLGVAVPFDDNISFHKVIATAIAIGVVLHGGAHLTCDFPLLLHASKEEYEPLEKYFGETQPVNYWWFLKGVEAVTGIAMVVLMTIAFTLAAPWFRCNKPNLPNFLTKLTGFNAFWYSHHLFVIVYALLTVHGIYLYLTHIWYQKTTWMYLAVPVLLYGSERMIRAFRSSIKPVQILGVAVYPENVVSLRMSKPQGYNYRSGQYMFIKCSSVSPFEWHPFSITSAPRDDYLSVHIRGVGDWTNKLIEVFSEICQTPTGGKSEILTADFMPGENKANKIPRILIDGPYGAPAEDYKNYEVVILMGLGIGATPMVSIVKDIINNMQNIDLDEEQGGQTPSHQPSIFFPSPFNNNKKKNNKSFKTRRAYYYWVTREQGSFAWFKGIMNEVAEMDKDAVIEFHNYCTSVYGEGDARSALITMLQSLHHAKNGVDVVSGTRVKSHFAKPNWREVFKKVARHHPDTRVGVFYCGPPGPIESLKKLALDFSHKTSTKFHFHKENF